MFNDISLRHIPALYATCAMGLGGARSLANPRTSLIHFGFPARIADRPEMWPVARVGHARTVSLGLIMALFYARGQYDVIDTIMGVMAGSLALVDACVVWNEGFHGNTTIEGPVPSDAGVAGTGVLLSFFFTAILALALSLTIILSEFRNKTSSIRRRLLSSYSDQQILQGIGIHAVGLAKRDTMLPYHFFIICFELAPGEEAWSFGQVLSVLVLLFPLVSMVEILRGELRVAPCDLSDGQACAPSDMEMNKFQPNPFWGSQTHLVRNSYSDQQILQGIGIHAVGLAKRDTMLPYHFFIIWCLGLLSQAVHNATLLSLVHDFRRDWVLRWLRQLLMFVNLGLSVVYGVFILRAVETGLADDPIPISCVWETNSGNGSSNRSGLSYFGTIAVMAANVLVFALASWYLHWRIQRFAKMVKLMGTLLMGALAAGAIVRCVLASDALGHGPSFELAPGEEAWSFGQVLSVLVLLFPLVSMVEILRGELRVAPCDLSDGQACAPSDMEMNKFQPNPFWGSQTHLVRK
ncbi:hypothetical protein BN1708_014399 [Verticillium longisporum]|uniref:Uncharacterized protein n=2 Tax=Verticillium longisporum TaxID=100787 RepID=A0A0G4LVT1_VERLO|nr:hypothetical protein BN1708_014399 [Verticillium longisporum]